MGVARHEMDEAPFGHGVGGVAGDFAEFAGEAHGGQLEGGAVAGEGGEQAEVRGHPAEPLGVGDDRPEAAHRDLPHRLDRVGAVAGEVELEQHPLAAGQGEKPPLPGESSSSTLASLIAISPPRCSSSPRFSWSTISRRVRKAASSPAGSSFQNIGWRRCGVATSSVVPSRAAARQI